MLREENWGDKFSEKYIKKELQTIIAKIIKSNEKQKDAKDLLEKLIRSLVNYNQEWIVLVPLSGLVMKLDSIKLGKVTFYPITKEKIKNLHTKIESIQVGEFERTLLHSVHWYSSSLTQYEIENQFLNLITCLETLLTQRDGNPIRTAIAEGVQFL